MTNINSRVKIQVEMLLSQNLRDYLRSKAPNRVANFTYSGLQLFFSDLVDRYLAEKIIDKCMEN